jgi:hypothetical protein
MQTQDRPVASGKLSSEIRQPLAPRGKLFLDLPNESAQEGIDKN